jgi:hypothetical protein
MEAIANAWHVWDKKVATTTFSVLKVRAWGRHNGSNGVSEIHPSLRSFDSIDPNRSAYEPQTGYVPPDPSPTRVLTWDTPGPGPHSNRALPRP